MAVSRSMNRFSGETSMWGHTYGLRDFGVAVLDNKLYLLGGYDTRERVCTGRILRYVFQRDEILLDNPDIANHRTSTLWRSLVVLHQSGMHFGDPYEPTYRKSQLIWSEMLHVRNALSISHLCLTYVIRARLGIYYLSAKLLTNFMQHLSNMHIARDTCNGICVDMSLG